MKARKSLRQLRQYAETATKRKLVTNRIRKKAKENDTSKIFDYCRIEFIRKDDIITIFDAGKSFAKKNSIKSRRTKSQAPDFQMDFP